MPKMVYSALNTGGTEVVSEGDRLRAQMQQQAIDNATRQAMLSEQGREFNMDYSDRGNARAQELAIQGTQASRAQSALTQQALANTGQANVANIGANAQLGTAQISNAPQMGYLRLAENQYNDTKPLRDAKAQNDMLDLAITRQFAQGVFGGAGQPGAPAPAPRAASGGFDLGGGLTLPSFRSPSPMAPSAPSAAPAASTPGGDNFGMTPLQSYIALKAASAGGSAPNFEGQSLANANARETLDDRRKAGAREEAKQALESGDVAGAKVIAAKGGVTLPIAPIEDFVGSNGGLTQDLGNMADSFVTRDTATIGWDPTDQDVHQILNERQRLVDALTHRGYPVEAAQREANRIVTNKIGSRGNAINAGATQNLLRQLGGGAPIAPAQLQGVPASGNSAPGGGY